MPETPRPLIGQSVDGLEALFEKAQASSDRAALLSLQHELEFRRVPRAKELKTHVEKVLLGLASPKTDSGFRASAAKPSPTRAANQGKSTARPKHKPTEEQEKAMRAFHTGGSLRINAYAGTGKTSTLQMLAHSTRNSGQYIAFNKSIVADAVTKFPEQVACSTVHSLAFKATPSEYKSRGDKMAGKLNANQVAQILGLPGTWRVDKEHSLKSRSMGFLVLESVKRYAQSGRADFVPEHVPLHGSLAAAPRAVVDAVQAYTVDCAKVLWARMCDPNDDLPLGHDGYVKLWALSEPRIAADYILLDEAQDTNPVVLEVLGKQTAQMVYVGDKYQQIYEWRGAVNAMANIETEHSTRLSQSFRFGPAIAAAASAVLRKLGEDFPLTGNPSINSRLGETTPRVVIARTNATTISALIEALDNEQKPHLVGGKGELFAMLEGVEQLKNGQPSLVPEFFGFENWGEVVEFSKTQEGAHLQTFVNLVQFRSEKHLMWALRRSTQSEEEADVVISTAHKSKGREWDRVRLMDDFLRSQPTKPGEEKKLDESEVRLFYVALTRAKLDLEAPSSLLDQFGVRGGVSVVGEAQIRKPGTSPPTPPPIPVAKPTVAPPPKQWTPPPVRVPEKPKPAPTTSIPQKPKSFLERLLGL